MGKVGGHAGLKKTDKKWLGGINEKGELKRGRRIREKKGGDLGYHPACLEWALCQTIDFG